MSLISGNKINMADPPLNDEIPIVLGESFFINDTQRQSTYLHFRFHDKPKGMDQSRPGHIQFQDNQQCSVKFKPINNSKCDYKFNGHAKASHENECFLWYDSVRNRMVLEKVGLTIGPLRWDRQFVQNNMKKSKASFQQIQDQNNDRLKNLGKKKKKKRTPKKKVNKDNKSSKTRQQNSNNNNISNKFDDQSDSENDNIVQRPIIKHTNFHRNTNNNLNRNRNINPNRRQPRNNIFSGNHKFNQHIRSNNNTNNNNNNNNAPQGLFGDSDSEDNIIKNESDQDSDINHNYNDNNNHNITHDNDNSNDFALNNFNIDNQNNSNINNNNNNNNNNYGFDGPYPCGFESSDDDDDSDDEKMKSINVNKKNVLGNFNVKSPQIQGNIPDIDDDLF